MAENLASTKTYSYNMCSSIRGALGRYEASSEGRVRSLYFVNGHARRLRKEPLVLSLNEAGVYPLVTLGDGAGHIRTELVHILVLESFVGPRPSPDHQCAHDNGNPKDNRLSNLTWKTRSANEADKLRHGTHIRGRRCPHAILTEAQVKEIRDRAAAGERFTSLGREFGTAATNIGRIVHRETWVDL